MLAVDRRRRRGDRRFALRVTWGSPATRSHIVDGEPGPEAGVRGHPPILCAVVSRTIWTVAEPADSGLIAGAERAASDAAATRYAISITLAARTHRSAKGQVRPVGRLGSNPEPMD